MKRHLLALFLCAIFLALPAPMLQAAGDTGDIGPVSSKPCDVSTGNIHFECIPQYVAQAVVFFFSFTGAISIVEIIWGGYEITMGGIIGTSDQGKNRVKFAIIGLVVSILSFGIINVVLDSSAR